MWDSKCCKTSGEDEKPSEAWFETVRFKAYTSPLLFVTCLYVSDRPV
jgi:hypothetical protein